LDGFEAENSYITYCKSFYFIDIELGDILGKRAREISLNF
jgi:hypothetical protein